MDEMLQYLDKRFDKIDASLQEMNRRISQNIIDTAILKTEVDAAKQDIKEASTQHRWMTGLLSTTLLSVSGYLIAKALGGIS